MSLSVVNTYRHRKLICKGELFLEKYDSVSAKDALKTVLEMNPNHPGALLAMARAWRSGGTWPRTPTILWNLLMLPVAWSMHGGGFWGAWPLAVAAILAIVAALMSGRHESDAVV